MAKAASGGGAESSIADELRRLGMKGDHVLVQMTERGELLTVKCEMPQCYDHKRHQWLPDQPSAPRSYPGRATAPGPRR